MNNKDSKTSQDINKKDNKKDNIRSINIFNTTQDLEKRSNISKQKFLESINIIRNPE